MLRFRTKTEFIVDNNITTTIHLVIENVIIDSNNITPIGYFIYYNNDNNNIIILKDLERKPFILDDMYYLELNLPELNDYKHIKNNINQRLYEFMVMRLENENGEHFNTNIGDWEVY